MNPFNDKITRATRHLALALLAGFVLVSCGGGGGGTGTQPTTTQPTTTQAGLTIIAINDASVPLITVATDKYGTEAIGVSVEKDGTGKPTRLTAIHYFASGVAGVMEVGLDGLPSVLSDGAGNKLVFTNYTDTTVDTTFIDHEGNQIIGPESIPIDAIALVEFRSSYATALQRSVGVQTALAASTSTFEDVAAFKNKKMWLHTAALGGSVVLCPLKVNTSVISTLSTAGRSLRLALGGCVKTLGNVASHVAIHGFGIDTTKLDLALKVADGASCLVDGPTDCFMLLADHQIENLESNDNDPPSRPYGLASLSVTHSKISIGWEASVDMWPFAVAGYRIFRDDAEIGYDQSTFFMDLKVSPGKQYCYKVEAYDVGGNPSGKSDPLCITTKTAPKPLAVTAAPTSLTSSSVTLSGSVNPNGFATNAFIQFGTTSAFGTELARQAVGNGVAPVNVQTTIGSLVPGATYYYRMVAINSEGSANYGTAQIFRAVAPVTAAPTISSVSPSSVTGSNNEQPLTINGSNFVSGANITLRNKSTGEVFPNRVASSFSSTQIIINPRLSTTAATWSVNVVNPDGASTGEYVFQVVAPPVVSPASLSFTELTPTSITATAKPFDATLTASGSNFNNVNKIVWVASGASTGTFTWTRFGSSWVDAFGVAKSVLADSDTSMRITPRVVGSNDTWSGTTNWTVTLTDTTGMTATKTFTVTYTPTSTTTPSALSITTTSLNPTTATVGTGYAAQQAMAATGGQTPYSWSASGLPNGMAINSSTGAIFGTPTVPGTFNFTVTVTDSSSPQKTASKVLSITVAAASGGTAPAAFTATGSAYCDTVGGTSTGAVQLNWGASSTATSYDIIRNGTLIYTTGATVTSFKNNATNLAGQTHSYIIRARNSSTTPTDSNTVSVSIPGTVCQVLLVVNGIASSYTATSGTYQPTISLSGSGFSSVVNQIYLTCAKSGISCGNYTWTSANWSGKYIVYSDTSAVIAPVLTVSTDPAGTYNWSVTFSGGGQSVTKYFTVTK